MIRLSFSALARWRDPRGAALVEFALLAPILIALLLGITAYGHYFLISHSAQQIANDAARASVAGLSAEEREDIATLSVQNGATRIGGIAASKVSALVDEQSGRVTVEVRVDARDAALMKLPLVPLPDPIIRRQALAHTGGVL